MRGKIIEKKITFFYDVLFLNSLKIQTKNSFK